MNSSLSSNLPVVLTKSGWPWGELVHDVASLPDALPRISIITPSFNQGAYLEETIRSIILQDYPNYELIIMDAGSTDNTVEVIKKYEPWITYWVSEKDRGQSHAIQKGLAHVTGDIVNWLNSDDLLAPGALYALARDFDLDSYDVFCGRCDYFVQDVGRWDLRNERMGLSATVGDTLLNRKINQPSTFFKTSVMKELGIDEQFHYTMDLDLWYRYLLRAGQGRVLLSDRLLTYFRLHESSKTVAQLPHFEGDVSKVFYNVLYSLDQPAVLLDFMRCAIPDIEFKPTRYIVNIPITAVSAFIRTFAWSAALRYNAIGNSKAARECLTIARKYGQTFDLIMFRQLIKHYVLPKKIVHWFTQRSLSL